MAEFIGQVSRYFSPANSQTRSSTIKLVYCMMSFLPNSWTKAYMCKVSTRSASLHQYRFLPTAVLSYPIPYFHFLVGDLLTGERTVQSPLLSGVSLRCEFLATLDLGLTLRLSLPSHTEALHHAVSGLSSLMYASRLVHLKAPTLKASSS
jgi:hypothetical protein